MRAGRLTTLARLGAMFERTSTVRGDADLHRVLEDVCRTIADLLGYNAVVVNVYRPAYDDMLTASAVGSEDSVKALVARLKEEGRKEVAEHLRVFRPWGSYQ